MRNKDRAPLACGSKGATGSRQDGAACVVAIWGYAGGAWASPSQIDPGTLSEIVLFPTLFATAAFLMWVLANHRQHQARLRMQHEFRLKVVDRLSSAPDVAALIASDGGGSLVRELLGREHADVAQRIIGTFKSGIILTATGVGLGIIAMVDDFGTGPTLEAFSILLLALGLGFLLAAFASWRLIVILGVASPSSAEASGPPEKRQTP